VSLLVKDWRVDSRYEAFDDWYNEFYFDNNSVIDDVEETSIVLDCYV
jgi:hypothetical protein